MFGGYFQGSGLENERKGEAYERNVEAGCGRKKGVLEKSMSKR